VVFTFPPLYGGAGRQALSLAVHLKRRGVSTLVLTARQERSLSPSEFLDGVPVVRLPVSGPRGLRRASFFLSAASYLFSHARSHDVFHVHGAYLRVIPIVLSARLLGKTAVVKMTSQGSDDPESSRQRRMGNLLLWALKRADAVISVSSQMSAVYRNSGLPESKLLEIPNGVQTEVFRPVAEDERRGLRVRLGLPRDAEIALFSGFVGYQKGIDTLLLAWASVVERRRSAYLVLLGPVTEDAPEGSPSVRELVSRSERTVVPGLKENVHEYLEASDVFVLPSRLEGLSNALLEAMSSGLACVASNLAGMDDVIENGRDGLLFPTGEVEPLASSILELFENPGTRLEMGKRARTKILDRYSIESVAGRYADLYERLVRRRRGGRMSE
jgi:glycosyltransferase involved in cell wall biosynthesis